MNKAKPAVKHNMKPDPKIIVALDYSDAELAMPLVNQLDPARCRLKVGKELFTAAGPEFVRQLVDKGFDVFLDLKFHDIPNTVAKACQSAAKLGVWMVNVHAQGGSKMMTAAKEAINECEHQPLLIAVTVLTSMSNDDLTELGHTKTADEYVQHLANLVDKAGLDGVVCSPKEVEILRAQHGKEFKLVTPGIRPSWSVAGDQQRITTPADAIRLGSDYLVIGRPITAADDPMEALGKIEAELTSVI